MKQEELIYLLEQHRLWWDSQGEQGATLTLSEENLEELDFSHHNLRGANLSRCYARGAKFNGVDMTSINVTNTDFRAADFSNSILIKTDFRYVQIDSKTCFDNVKASGMVVDFTTYQQLPEAMRLQRLLKTNTNIVELVFETKSEMNRDLIVQILNDLSTNLEQNTNDLNIKTLKEGSMYRYVVEAKTDEDIAKVRQDMQVFGDILSGKIQTPNNLEYSTLQVKYTVLEKMYEMQNEVRLDLRMRLATSQADIVQLKEELKTAHQERKQFLVLLGQLSESLSEQATRQPLLPAPSNQNVFYTFTTKSHKDLVVKVSDIICVLSEGNRIARVYCVEGDPKGTEITFAKFEDLLNILQGKDKNLVKVNKGTVINLVYAELHLNSSSAVVFQTYKNKPIIVGRDVIFEGKTKFLASEVIVGRDYRGKFEEWMKNRA